MKFDWRNNRDFFAGLFYIVIGASGWYMALDYPFGSALRMGPGYFPIVLSVIMIVFGTIIGITGPEEQHQDEGYLVDPRADRAADRDGGLRLHDGRSGVSSLDAGPDTLIRGRGPRFQVEGSSCR